MNKEIHIKTEEYLLSDHTIKWKIIFNEEKLLLKELLPKETIGTIEHIGSTAIQGIKAKPIIDMLMTVRSQEIAAKTIAPILESKGYTHIIHTGLTKDEPPICSRFIKRNEQGERTHHIWCAEPNTAVWRRVLFVRYLNENPLVAKQYEQLKIDLFARYPGERRKYLEGKSKFINATTKVALAYYSE